MTINEKIYKMRTDLGLSQKEFAEKVGTSQSAINFWENGKRQPRISQIKKIASAFKLPLYALTDDDFEIWDVSNELENNRARFINPANPTKRPGPFTTTQKREVLDNSGMIIHGNVETTKSSLLSSLLRYLESEEYTDDEIMEIKQFADFIKAPIVKMLDENHFNHILQKEKRGQKLTPEEKDYKTLFLGEKFRKLVNKFTGYYSMLNEEGRKKADKEISRTLEFLMLISQVPEYQDKLNDKE